MFSNPNNFFTYTQIHGKNDFVEMRAKILLDTDLKIILLAYQNNFVEILKINKQCCKKF